MVKGPPCNIDGRARWYKFQTHQTHGAGVAVAIHPVEALVLPIVLARVLVESAAARHAEQCRGSDGGERVVGSTERGRLRREV
jgi:hypothetical protein